MVACLVPQALVQPLQGGFVSIQLGVTILDQTQVELEVVLQLVVSASSKKIEHAGFAGVDYPALLS